MSLKIMLNIPDIASLHGKDITHKEGDKVEIQCVPPNKEVPIVWLRVVDDAIEFIGSFHKNGMKRDGKVLNPIYSERISENKIYIKRFDPRRDSGVYSCAAMTSNELIFGEGTRLQRGESSILYKLILKHTNEMTVHSLKKNL